VAILLGLAIHFVLNVVVKEFPPEGATAAELEAYLELASGGWAVINGFRYVAFACILLFAAALFVRTCRDQPVDAAWGWGTFGLLGAATFVTNGLVANALEAFVFLGGPLVTANQDLFWLVFRLTRVLFTAEVVLWSFLILGFSVAGWRTARLPKWIAVLGLLQVSAGLVSGVFITSVLAGGWALMAADIASILGLLWFLSTGADLLIRGDSI
jgi:hypothetical protein